MEVRKIDLPHGMWVKSEIDLRSLLVQNDCFQGLHVIYIQDKRGFGLTVYESTHDYSKVGSIIATARSQGHQIKTLSTEEVKNNPIMGLSRDTIASIHNIIKRE